jgi:hypothetical protein
VQEEELEEIPMEVDSDEDLIKHFEDTPTDPRAAIPHMAKGLSKMAKMMIKLKKMVKGKPKDGGSSSTGPVLRRSQTESPSTRKRRQTRE